MKGTLTLIGGKKIFGPKSEKTRPTTLMVREALFNIINKSVKNSYWLDLFSGTGSIACEALNHGAKKIIAIEKNRLNSKLCKKNLLSLKNSIEEISDIYVICKDVFSILKLLNSNNNFLKTIKMEDNQFDFIYIDPPYENDYSESILKLIFNSNIIKKSTLVIFEHSKFKNIEDSEVWKVKDTRSYGHTKISFLIKI